MSGSKNQESDLDVKIVYVAWAPIDLTEGRGESLPKFICGSRSTAERLGIGQSVQRTDCRVTKEVAVKFEGRWCAPAHIIPPTSGDSKNDARLAAGKKAEEKALRAGLSHEDIADLRGL